MKYALIFMIYLVSGISMHEAFEVIIHFKSEYFMTVFMEKLKNRINMSVYSTWDGKS